MSASRARSDSTSSSKELSADNLQISVNINGDKTIKLNVRPVHSVSNVLEFLSASTTLPTDVRLLHDGQPLEPSSTVGELQLSDSSVLRLDPPHGRPKSPTVTATNPAVLSAQIAEGSAPSSGTSTPTSTASKPSTPRKSNKPRCSKQGCKALAPPIVGDCGFCSQRFCGKHRMLESHNCAGLEDARQADKDRNTAKLEMERTTMLRGL